MNKVIPKIAGVAGALCLITSLGVPAQNQQPDHKEGVGQVENIVASGSIDRANGCPGEGCTAELVALVEQLTGIWQSDVTDFNGLGTDDPRSKATKHVHIMRLATNGKGVFDASPNSGESWCRAAFDWTANYVSADNSVTLNRVFNEDATCKRTPPGAAKPLFVRFVETAHGEAIGSPLPTMHFRGRSNSWDAKIRVYYHKCGMDPAAPSTTCKPIRWRPDVDVGEMHAKNMSPWVP